MADDYSALGSETTKFLTKPNWVSMPSFDALHQRDILAFPGTTKEFYAVTSAQPITIEYEFLNKTKAEESTLLTFFAGRLGRLTKFWLPMWISAFRLAEAIEQDDTTAIVQDVCFTDIHRGDERIFIETVTGDMITRAITDCADNGDGTETLTFNTAITRDIALADVMTFGRFLLVRLDVDKLSLRMKNDSVSSYQMRFIELVKEYPAL